MASYIKNIDGYFKERNILKPRVNSLSRYLKYLLKYSKTGFKYGVFDFEDNILQELITNYWTRSYKIDVDAEIWHKVLY